MRGVLIGAARSLASRSGAPQIVCEGRKNPFTAALLKQLATPSLDIGSVLRRVRVDVVQATRGKQVPWDHSSLMGDVVLAR